MLSSANLKLSDSLDAGSLRAGSFFELGAEGPSGNHTFDRSDFRPAASDVKSFPADLSKRARAFKNHVSHYAMYFSSEFRIRLLKQIDVLFDEDEWDEDDALPSENSFKALLRGLVLLKPLHRPALGLSSEGNILAMWSNETSKVSLEFIAGDLIRWSGTLSVAGPPDQIASRTATIRLGEALSGFGLRGLIDGA